VAYPPPPPPKAHCYWLDVLRAQQQQSQVLCQWQLQLVVAASQAVGGRSNDTQAYPDVSLHAAIGASSDIKPKRGSRKLEGKSLLSRMMSATLRATAIAVPALMASVEAVVGGVLKVSWLWDTAVEETLYGKGCVGNLGVLKPSPSPPLSTPRRA
jgi:hypothetical protein